MKEYWFMNFKLQFERHLQFTAVILLQQSHGFVVLIIPCYHAVKLKKLISTTEPVVHALWYSNISSMHHECIHQCTINALITASSMHRASCNTSSMHSLYQMHQFRSFSSSFHHQCIVSAFINASPMYSSVYSSLHHQGNPSMHHQCFVNTLSMPSPTNHQSIVSAFVNASSMHSSTH